MGLHLLEACVALVALLSACVIVECNTECTVWGKTISDIRSGKISNPASSTTRTTCTWTFKVQTGQVLELNFTKINLTPAHQCQFAQVQIVAEDYKIRVCGTKTIVPAMYFKGQQDVEVEYKFSRESKQTQFTLEYKLVKQPSERCAEPMVKCENRECVSRDAICNGMDDCGDGTDESSCGHKATAPAECGLPAIEPEPGNEDRVTGGREAVPGSWPWQVSFQVKSLVPSGHFCGGSLINDMWILTAAHCFQIISADDIRVKLGDHRSFEDDAGEAVRYPEKILIHPSYRDDIKDKRNDIALVKLKAPITYSDTVSPVCLPKNRQVVPAKTELHVTGWGRTLGSLSPPIQTTALYLKQAMVQTVEWKECFSENLEKLAMETICTSYGEDGTGPCLGDSGGPLVGQDSQTGRWTIFGVVSWGKTTCEFSTAPAVFTKVSTYITWIDETMRNN